ncbi:hypothetical protein DFH09DRAFT_900038 [Mycena vulgaris]|nr:hypothetical protein DFH09DRAFT_900038 [Mycena vulgaris]
MIDDDEKGSDDGDFRAVTLDGREVFNIQPHELAQIWACIRDIQLPSWVGRPPSNLGEASHGKLKAQEFLILFTAIFPLIVPEFWWRTDSTGKKLLDNFYDLVACTNIISSYTTSDNEADKYLEHYIRYRTSIVELFPEFNHIPNHHYAMHNRDLLKFWGPMATLSEFPGEQMNGRFGKIKMNHRIHMFYYLYGNDMDLTMLRQMSRRGRLEAYFKDSKLQEVQSIDPIHELAQILQPDDLSDSGAPLRPLDGSEVANILGRGKDLPQSDYNIILKYLQSIGQPWCSNKDMPHPVGALILPPQALALYQHTVDQRVFSCKKANEGNSAIQFKNPFNNLIHTMGYITRIWQLILQGHMQTFFVVEQHKPLLLSDQ